MSIPKKILLEVEKPARYTGGEYHTPPDNADAKLRFALCMPDVYEVAMSNLGIRILYGILNERADTACERCFAPWPDMAAKLRENNLPLASLETGRPLKDFGIVGFSLQYELSYSTMLYMLDLARIPRRRSGRGDGAPIIIAGGPCTVNSAPLEDFIDLFCVGDGEEVISQLADLYIKHAPRGKVNKKAFLQEASSLRGVYAPEFNPSGQNHTVKRAYVEGLTAAYYPVKFLVPNIEAVHDRAVLELFRGCTRGCRFCQAGMANRPVRERPPEKLAELAEKIVACCGYEELSLSSLSTGDYPHLNELIKELKKIKEKYNVNLSLPSLRADSFEAEFADSGRKSSLTFAPEAGTQRLRDVVNKNITGADIERSAVSAFSAGYSSVKLYFIIGLPTETDDDIQGIVDIACKLRRLYKEHGKGGQLRISLSTSVLVPKPFTPFQRVAQAHREIIEARQEYLKTRLKKLGVNYSYHDYKASVLECVFSRGDARLAEVIEKAADYGCFFDGWTEQFKYGLWLKAFEDCGVNISDYTREFSKTEKLPWDFIDIGVSKAYLEKEYAAALKGETTPDCREGCLGCGLHRKDFGGCENRLNIQYSKNYVTT